MISDPQVCVIIAAWNAERTIARAVRSALAQRYVTEVIVCDDASRDATVAIARDCDDDTGRLSIITLGSNIGPGAARNVALAASGAPLVCLLDADDYMLPGRIARLLEAAGEGWDFAADDIVIVPEALDSELIELPEQNSTMTLRLPDFIRSNISRPGRPQAELGFMKPIMSRAFLDRNGLRYDETLRLGEDYALYVQALIAGAVFKVAGACGYVAVERGAFDQFAPQCGGLETHRRFRSRAPRIFRVAVGRMSATLSKSIAAPRSTSTTTVWCWISSAIAAWARPYAP